MFAGAQTITPQLGDLILGFHATGGVGQALNLEVDLGSISNLYNAAPNSVIPLPELSLQDISDTYGASWSTRTDLFWGAVATTGRGSGTPDGHAPLATLWATDPTGQAAWNRGSTNAQKTASATIETVFVPGANGSLYGATATSNSSAAASIAAALPGSWSSGDLKIGGTSFGYFNPTIDGAVTNGTSVLGLYELQPGGNPGTNPGTDLGQLVLSPSGLSFVAVPEASTGILVALGIGTTLLLRRRRD
jgi:hypothetical protein